jgi:hypothetical protein
MRLRIYRSQCTLLQLCGEVDDGDSCAHALVGAKACNFLILLAAIRFAKLKEQALECLP